MGLDPFPPTFLRFSTTSPSSAVCVAVFLISCMRGFVCRGIYIHVFGGRLKQILNISNLGRSLLLSQLVMILATSFSDVQVDLKKTNIEMCTYVRSSALADESDFGFSVNCSNTNDLKAHLI